MTLKLAGEMPSAARAGARIDCLLHSFKEGQYIHSLPFMALATGSLGAGRLYAVPMVAGRRMALDRIAVEVTAAAADKLLRLGIYSNSRSLYPADLLLDAGTVPVATTGVKSLDIAVVLEAGLCWLVCVSDGAPQLTRDGFPAVVLAPDGRPGITVPKTDAPESVETEVLKRGDGETVESGDQVLVQYTSVNWESGEVADSTWEAGTPADLHGHRRRGCTAPAGVAEPVIGQTVGSQIGVIVPGEDGATLFYVIDILGVL